MAIDEARRLIIDPEIVSNGPIILISSAFDPIRVGIVIEHSFLYIRFHEGSLANMAG
jgi:hypothetical protein